MPSPVNPFPPASYNNAGSDAESHRKTSPSKEAPDTAAPSKKRAASPYETGRRAKHRDLLHRDDGPAHSSSTQPSVVDAPSAKEKESAAESDSAQGVMAFRQSIGSLSVDPESALRKSSLVAPVVVVPPIVSQAPSDLNNKPATTETTDAQQEFKQRIEALDLDPKLPLPAALKKVCSWHGAMTKTLDVYRVNGNAVLVWTQGPRAGKIYDVVTVPTMKGPSPEEFLKEIHKNLHALYRLWGDQKHDSEENIQTERNLSVELFKSYFGEPGRSGLQHFRFADSKLNELLCQIDREGIVPWLNEQARSLGLNIYVHGLIDSRNKGFYEFFTMEAKLPDLEDVVLEHSSHGSIVDSVINAGGLIANARIPKVGLVKLSGLSQRKSDDDWRADAHVISFFDHSNNQDKKLLLGYGGLPGGFDYPISFTINKEKASQLPLKSGLMGAGKETVVEGHLPLDFINRIFVPWFAVEDTQHILNQHGHGHIKVEELTREGVRNSVWGGAT